VKAQELELVEKGDRVVVSQCPRLLPDGMFNEAAVVKFVVVGETLPQNFPKHGSCMDISNIQKSNSHNAACSPESHALASVEA
jgi:hypothetical protein